MNWYSIYCFSFRNPFDLDAVVICKEMYETIKDLYSSGKLENQTKNYTISPDRFKNPELSNVVINLTIEKLENLVSDFEIGGYFLENNTIEILLRVSDKFSNQSFERLYSRLFDVVRHEIQHLINYVRSGRLGEVQKGSQTSIVEKIQSASNFILSDRELEPYIRGMMFIAKKQRIPFKNIVIETIDRNFYGGSAEYKNRLKALPIFNDIKRIENMTFDKIIQKALEIYPNLNKKKEFYERNI